MSNTDLLLFEKRGHVGYLTLNRPEKRNPLGLSGDGEAFAAAARKINGDFDLRCVIMTGAGSA
jgi:enoyl-CoA hydratase/carnithine racemase